MIQTHTCTSITCDDCAEDCFEEGVPHFDSLDKAKNSGWFEEWLMTETEQVCPSCHGKRICDAEGHAWGEWRQWPRDVLSVVRFCDRCSAADYTVAAHAEGTP